MSIGERLQSLRWQSGLYAWQVGEQIGVKEGHVTEHESKHYKPKLQTLRRYARFYNITLSELLRGVE